MTELKIDQYDSNWYNSPEHHNLIEQVEDINEHAIDRIRCACKIATHSTSVLEKEYWIQYILELCENI